MSISVMKDCFGDVIPKWCSGLLDYAYNYFLLYEYINFTVELATKSRIPTKPSVSRVIFIGTSLVGLVAARQLMLFEFEVIVLERLKSASGRFYT